MLKELTQASCTRRVPEPLTVHSGLVQFHSELQAVVWTSRTLFLPSLEAEPTFAAQLAAGSHFSVLQRSESVKKVPASAAFFRFDECERRRLAFRDLRHGPADDDEDVRA